MAFTRDALLTELQDSGSNMQATITQFIPGSTYTDVYVVNNYPSKTKSGPMVQVLNTRTAAQARADIDTAMS